MNIFLGGFWFLSAVCAVMYFVTRAALPAPAVAGFTQFQRSYLLVYLLAMGMQRLTLISVKSCLAYIRFKLCHLNSV